MYLSTDKDIYIHPRAYVSVTSHQKTSSEKHTVEVDNLNDDDLLFVIKKI